MQKYDYPRPVYTKDFPKDVPEHLLVHHWPRTVDFNKLPKFQLEVEMCCAKCKEKVVEEIWEVPGVFDVSADWIAKKVVVTAAVREDGLAAVDKYAVLRKAKKIDCRARFVDLKEPPQKPNPPNPDRRKKLPKEEPLQVFHPPAFRPPEFRPPSPIKPSLTYPSELRPLPPHRIPPHLPPQQDGMIPGYFVLFLLLVLLVYLSQR